MRKFMRIVRLIFFVVNGVFDINFQVLGCNFPRSYKAPQKVGSPNMLKSPLSNICSRGVSYISYKQQGIFIVGHTFEKIPISPKFDIIFPSSQHHVPTIFPPFSHPFPSFRFCPRPSLTSRKTSRMRRQRRSTSPCGSAVRIPWRPAPVEIRSWPRAAWKRSTTWELGGWGNTPRNAWFIGENPMKMWMMAGGIPGLGNLHTDSSMW